VVALVVATIALVISSLIFFNRAPPTTIKTPLPGARAASALATIPEKSIAILPFENLSEAKENAYFADGVQDEILTDLAKIAILQTFLLLKVRSRRRSPTSSKSSFRHGKRTRSSVLQQVTSLRSICTRAPRIFF